MVEDDTRPFAHGRTSLRATTRSGRAVCLRHLEASDDALLVELYGRLSPETRRLRFMTVPHDVPAELLWREAHRLSDLDPCLAAAIVATIHEDGQERAVAVCRLARDADDSHTAEMAIVIRDDYQRDGLGGLMLDLVIQLAMVGGVSRIRAVSFAENEGLHRLVVRTGLPVHTSTSHGETTQVIDIA